MNIHHGFKSFLLASFCLSLALSLAMSSPSQALDCSRPAGSLPNVNIQAGTEDRSNPIEHIIVLMQENHSFDAYFGMLSQPQFYGKQIDGLSSDLSNADSSGKRITPFREPTLCEHDPNHSWNAEHRSWNKGNNGGFVQQNGPSIMGYYDEHHVPYYYALADQFAVADRYFCSALAPTFPNRYFLYAATSFGHIENDRPWISFDGWPVKTIFDVLDQFHISWKYYTDDKGYLTLFASLKAHDQKKMQHIANYSADLASNHLPSVVFLDAAFDGEDEHPNANIQKGQSWVAQRINELFKSKAWTSSALFLTYDENGGSYDHVPPPQACVPDSTLPKLGWLDDPGAFDVYGFRVPFVAISPYAKRHFVSHQVYDHTSILKFIETKYNLPALTRRDANADAMKDLFDFQLPNLSIPNLPVATVSNDCSNY